MNQVQSIVNVIQSNLDRQFESKTNSINSTNSSDHREKIACCKYDLESNTICIEPKLKSSETCLNGYYQFHLELIGGDFWDEIEVDNNGVRLELNGWLIDQTDRSDQTDQTTLNMFKSKFGSVIDNCVRVKYSKGMYHT